jgi:serine/threonine protein kinase
LTPKIIKGKDGKALIPSSKPLSSYIQDPNLCDFLEKILKLNPDERITPLKALVDPWILAYFPEKIRKEHLNEILLKIKKEEGESNERENASSSARKGHKKRNS